MPTPNMTELQAHLNQGREQVSTTSAPDPVKLPSPPIDQLGWINSQIVPMPAELTRGQAEYDAGKPLAKALQEAKTRTVFNMLKLIGDDPWREGLLETPERVVKAWDEWFSGYKIDIPSLFKSFEDGAPEANGDHCMVLETDIPVFSWCEHHMAPIVGFAHVAYIPDKKIVGLSKLARVVDAYARRLQVQERLTENITAAIFDNLKCRGAGVIITAEHFCMCTRGVKINGVKTTTSSLRGVFSDKPEVREEFLKLVGMTKTHR